MSSLNQFIQETEAMAASAGNVVSFREARAKRIRELGNKWTECTFQLGQELEAVKATFPKVAGRGSMHTVPGWEEWLDKEVGIGLRYANSLIQIWEKFGGTANSAVAGTSFRVLQFLARETVPESARDEVIERIQSGERVGKETAEKIAKIHAAPSPEEARKIARETGRPTLARDGNIYLGATKEQEKQIEARRELVYGVRHAIEALATVGMPADKFLKQAFPHQLWNAKEEHLIVEALGWLTDLKMAWERR
jgi:Protein of unknown function (DUF3102).